MTGPIPRPPRASPVLLVLSAVPLVALGALSPSREVAIAAVVAGTAAGVVLTSVRRGTFGRWAPGPVLVLAGGIVVSAPVSPLAELLAGAEGMLLLLVVARSVVDSPPLRFSLPALGFPALALGVALGAAYALPQVPNAVGAAGLLVVTVFVLLAWLFARGASDSAPAPPPS